MKTRSLLILAALVPCCAGPLPCPAAPLTPAQAATVRDIQAKAEAAIREDDAEKAEELTEHQAHLAARQEADALGKAAATAAAQRDAEKARADGLAKRVRALHWTLVFVCAGMFVVIYAAGATIQLGLQVVVTVVGKLLTRALKWCLALFA